MPMAGAGNSRGEILRARRGAGEREAPFTFVPSHLVHDWSCLEPVRFGLVCMADVKTTRTWQVLPGVRI